MQAVVVGTKNKINDSIRHRTLSMYNTPPRKEVSLDEFEAYGIDRLYVLKAIETARTRGPTATKLQKNNLDKTLGLHMPIRKSTQNDPERQHKDLIKDEISHYILRLAFCQTEDLRRWFVSHEVYLFRHRFKHLTKYEQDLFMKRHGVMYEEATKEEIEQRLHHLKKLTEIQKLDGSEVFYKIPFTETLELVSKRQVYLEKGIAYVPFDHIVSILANRFRVNLSRQLAVALKHYNRSLISRDERLRPVLKNLAKHHIGTDYTTQTITNTNAITADMVNDLSKQSMPLCMKTLHMALTSMHHLKHGGRMQYTLFLKGIGLNLDEAMIFWRKEFCKKMTVDDFNKKYAYNIRHNYGQEGKKKDYTPFSCMKIISGEPPKSGDYHGCPFRHYDEAHLKSALRNIRESDRENILQYASTKQYQLACKRHFEALHPNGNSDAVGNHPNAYFEESRKYHENHAIKKEEMNPLNMKK